VRPQLYAVVGSPIRHSLSPRMQQAAFDACRISATYEAFEARSARPIFEQLRSQGYSGWNVTTPLKEQAVECVDSLTKSAAEANAINVVRREHGKLVGHNTDGAGFVRAIEQLWSKAALRGNILILGGGPAARAIALELRAAGALRLYCWSRDERKAAAIGARPQGGMDLVVSALPKTATVPARVMALASRAEMVFDLNYSDATSPVASIAARKRSNGLPLLLHQGILSFEWWTGVAAPVAAMRAAIKCPAANR
jgi:shikimate dehydrogenase